MLNILETQKKLIAAAMPSGYETPQAKVLEELARPYADEVYYDALGSLICHKKGPKGGKKLMIAAHMDVIGLIALCIDERGFIRFGTIGGVTGGFWENIPVRFENGVRGCVRYDAKGDIPSKTMAQVATSSLYIDIGAKNHDEAASLIKVGDVAVYDAEPVAVAGGSIVTPYADGLVACIALCIAIEAVQQSPNDLYFVFTVQEERGRLGAGASAYSLAPDMGIAVGLTQTGDTPGETVKMAVTLGKGPTIKVKDASHICNTQAVQYLHQAARKAKIACQDEVSLAGGTGSAAIQLSRGGVVSGAVSIPGRNLRSPGEIIHLRDVEMAGKLLVVAAQMAI
jgi:endoglucanase